MLRSWKGRLWLRLSPAIDLLEKAGRGEVVKGEKVGDGIDAQFNLVVLSKDSRISFNVNATGKVIVETALSTARPKGNGSKKTALPQSDDGKSKATLPKADDAKKSDPSPQTGSPRSTNTPKTGTDTRRKGSSREREDDDRRERERRLDKMSEAKKTAPQAGAAGTSNTPPRPSVTVAPPAAPAPAPRPEPIVEDDD